MAKHTRKCIDWALAAIVESNNDTRADNERDGTNTRLSPETDAYAVDFIDDGMMDCTCQGGGY